MKVKVKTFLLGDKKLIKVVILHLLIRTNTKSIQNYLEDYRFQNITVTQMYKGSMLLKKYMPLFLVSMPRFNNIDELFSMTELMMLLLWLNHTMVKRDPHNVIFVKTVSIQHNIVNYQCSALNALSLMQLVTVKKHFLCPAGGVTVEATTHLITGYLSFIL